MNSSIIRAVVIGLAALLSGGAYADGAALFRAADYIGKTAEAAQLTERERARLDKLRSDPAVRSASAVSINFAALASGAVTVTLPDGQEVQLLGAAKVANEKFTHWRGESKDRESSAIIVFSRTDKDEFSGTIRHAGRVFELFPIRGERRQAIVEMNKSTVGDVEVPSPKREAPATSKAAPGKSARALGAGDPTIRILTAYTSSASNWLGGATEARTDQELSNLNQAFANSGVALNVASAGTLTIPDDFYNVNGVLFTAATAQQDLKLLTQRDQADADVIMITLKGVDNATGAAPVYATPENAIAAIQATAFGEYAYQHEFGHLAGARHQASGGVAENDPTSFPAVYGHGYWVRWPWGTSPVRYYCFHTIMSYAINQAINGACDNTDSRIPNFSNPYINVHAGLTDMVPSGSGGANNALALNTLGPAMATFHNTKVSLRSTAAVLSSLLLGD